MLGPAQHGRLVSVVLTVMRLAAAERRWKRFATSFDGSTVPSARSRLLLKSLVEVAQWTSKKLGLSVVV